MQMSKEKHTWNQYILRHTDTLQKFLLLHRKRHFGFFSRAVRAFLSASVFYRVIIQNSYSLKCCMSVYLGL